ncbi:LysR family transcriptional regulator [Zavarzinia compransoris]|uniref:LysR family transcriptional regulator n=1 Tax=Zavarzinia compransoris TaxID=1264899 RepID=A0A317EAE9_9PROT|nr:LysR family transcriptional regulator [Zavarzinia compransoris]PWR23651.1 LysR family transcriptional regulator [Zavarzinia compransoris]TDP47869.1 LysR family transcriptional regulator [Zavarzinia compransoris]
MNLPDLNLLVALEAVLAEGSVAGAARRLRLSPSAMSRTLARLREATGDPLLVRAGRGLVPTPRALELRDRVGPLVEAAAAMLRPVVPPDPSSLVRDFTLRCSDGFAESFGPALLRRIADEAPAVRLRFMAKTDKNSDLLRQGRVDLETGVLGGGQGPELRIQALFGDSFVGVVRPGHPLAQGAVGLAAYLAARHVQVARRDQGGGPVDAMLEAGGQRRDVAVTVGGFAPALALVREMDLVATVPARHTAALRAGLIEFPLPFAVPALSISMLWHPRNDADPGHRWLRELLRSLCAAQTPSGTVSTPQSS